MVFLNFYTSIVNLSCGFLHTVKIIHIGIEFYNAMVKRFLLYFPNAKQMQKSKYAKVKVNIGPKDGDLDGCTCSSCQSNLEHCSGLGLNVNHSSFPLM
jgi:hypothetical protein